jgi:hypothetical protein
MGQGLKTALDYLDVFFFSLRIEATPRVRREAG